MMSSIQFTGTVGAWLSNPEYQNIGRVIGCLKKGDNQSALNYITYSGSDMATCGWVKVGTASVTVTLDSVDTITASQVQSLQHELEAFRAKAHLHEQAILERISKLQALTFDGVTA